MAFISTLIDPEEVRRSGAFTILPVRRNPRYDVAEKAYYAAVRDWEHAMRDGRYKTFHGSYCDHGDLLSLCFPECPPDHLAFLAYISELMIIQDGQFITQA
jgi:hypothetical protein